MFHLWLFSFVAISCALVFNGECYVGAKLVNICNSIAIFAYKTTSWPVKNRVGYLKQQTPKPGFGVCLLSLTSCQPIRII